MVALEGADRGVIALCPRLQRRHGTGDAFLPTFMPRPMPQFWR
jgi:hypothetical protein